MTPTHAAALRETFEYFDLLKDALGGLPDEAVNWTPAPNTNSIAVLVHHSIAATRFWLRNGSGQVDSISRYRSEDRAPAFQTSGASAASLAEAITAAAAEFEQILAAGTPECLDVAVQWDEDPAAGRHAISGLMHATSHLAEHVGQAQLMRDLWLAR
ncbi:MAG TPA: DUF664 domain-containing protein [Tepidiformaceae bacterium]|nr:DUF664 domain-containing protein [Tepidiformaceae bacterium]HMO95281.1 DUF664 domain-containing protein [Tepidiformaceae bacterium]